MEGMRFGLAFARAALAIAAALAVVACATDTPNSTPSPIPTYAPYTGEGLFPTLPQDTATNQPSPVAPDSPMTTCAAALDHPRRGSQAPDGAILFGTDYSADGKSVTLVGQRTTFVSGREIAWRLSLPAATGGESVRVTLSTESGTVTQVDSFVAQGGWNVYYGKTLLTVSLGTYVLHYLFDGHEVGSGTFKVKAMDAAGPTPTPTPRVD